MVIRRYKSSDCREIIELFYHTVHAINAKDYTEAQLNVWASGNENLEKWDRTLAAHFTIVAVENDKMIGFGDIDRTGYLDRLYVHKDYQRRGVAAAICDVLERGCDVSKITVYASITAKPFFEHRGYQVIKNQQVLREGVSLTNYIMEKEIKVLTIAH